MLRPPAFAGQGHTDSRVECRRPLLRGLATSVALLIELKAQFYKLVTINRCFKGIQTCEMVNKSSKSNLCYIDSDLIRMRFPFCAAGCEICRTLAVFRFRFSFDSSEVRSFCVTQAVCRFAACRFFMYLDKIRERRNDK